MGEFWSSDWRHGTSAAPLSQEEFEAIRKRQADDTGEHTVGTPIQQIHSDRLALLDEVVRLRNAATTEAHDQPGEVKRAFLAGHIAGSNCAGWWAETATDEQRLQAAEKDWERDGSVLVP